MAKGLTKFVGRKNSMAALKEAYEKALSGSGQVVGIVGEAGVGKSRLFSNLEINCLRANIPILRAAACTMAAHALFADPGYPEILF